MNTAEDRHHFPTEFPPQGVSFDLPEAPRALGHELPLRNAPVAAHLMRGETVFGKLADFNNIDGKVVVRSADGKLTIVPFINLRFLIFSRQIISAEELHLTTKTSPQSVNRDGRSIELIFRDGKRFFAVAETMVTEPCGFHIFMQKPDAHVYRVFVPRNTIKQYISGQQAEQDLENGEIDVRHPDVESAENLSKGEPLVSMAKNSLELVMALQNKPGLPQQSLGQLLCAQQLVTQEQVDNALKEQKRRPAMHLGDLLIEKGIVGEEAIQTTLAYKLGLPFVVLQSFDIDPEALSFIPRELAVKFLLVPLFMHEGRLAVATSNPTDSDSLKMAEFMAKRGLELAVATSADIQKAIDKHYGKRDDDEVFETLETIDSATEDAENYSLIREAEKLSKERPIVRMVQNTLMEAVRSKASDIHIRPGENEVDLIFRIDGSLLNIRRFSKTIYAAVVSRIKIIGRMDISERRIPQDGRAIVMVNNHKVDLRISVMPTVNGESVVVRLLDTMVGLKSLDQLGFDERNAGLLKDMISKSYGVLLVTGPTGSGKSTTLYAAIEHIRKTNVNIITAEDPVEYHIAGIEQMQVNHKVGYTFARILRNILRHDPDVIMVGEIRDEETAKIAIESALTGHLVLSTLHTNSATVTLTRLLEMGVQPYLINDTLLGVLAQRLVRTNCVYCLEEEQVDSAVYEALTINPDETFYKGKGCEKCRNTGYKGRMAVYELLAMTPELRKMVSKGVGADFIEAKAIEEGMVPLTQNALKAAREQKTSLAEVYRVRLS
ncbi:MAG: GspE/PulE family protein [Gammaproteobacteria bacterium]|jgi:type IV pilus assembly protein PilB